MSHQHPSFASKLGLGIVVAARATHHPELIEKPDGTLDLCAVCNEYVVLAPTTVLFRLQNPLFPLLCCLCGEVSVTALRVALPNADFHRQPVPDLSGLLN